MATKTPKNLDVDVLEVNRGLFFDRPVSKIPKGGMISCNNVRISEGKVIRDNMGWSKFFSTGQVLDGPVTLIDNFFESSGSQFLIFGTSKSLYKYDGANKATYINPVYVAGTMTSSTGSAVVAGQGTLWDTTVNGRKNALPGDMMFFGTANEDDPTLANWGEILTVDSDTQVTLTANAPVSLTTQPYTVSQRYAGTVKNYWNTETFYKASVGNEDTWYATNGIDFVVKWNGTDATVTPLHALGLTCIVLAAKSNMMIYGNIVVGGEVRPKSIRNSVIGNPEDVTTAPEAAENVVDDGTDEILEIFRLGDNLVMYSGRSITLAQFIGGNEVWAFRTTIDGIGPLAGRGIMDFGDTHEFLGPDSQYEFNGLTVTEINGHVWRDVIKRRAPNRLWALQSHINEETGDLLWTVPLSTDTGDDEFGSPQTAFVQHYLEDPQVNERGNISSGETPFTQRQMAMTASGFFERSATLLFSDILTGFDENNQRWNDSFFQAAFPWSLFGDEDGNIFILGEADSHDGTDITSIFRIGRFISADGRHKTIIKRLYPFFEQLIGTITITVLTADTYDGPSTQIFTGPFDMQLLEDETFVSVFKQARYYEIEFSLSGSGKPFSFSGMIIENKLAGKR